MRSDVDGDDGESTASGRGRGGRRRDEDGEEDKGKWGSKRGKRKGKHARHFMSNLLCHPHETNPSVAMKTKEVK